MKKRKLEHIELAATGMAERGKNGLEKVRLRYAALSDVWPDNVDISSSFLGYDLSFPFFIAPITGGFGLGGRINQILAKVAEECKVALFLGSLRPAVQNQKVIQTYDVKPVAPDIPVVANIGVWQLQDHYFVSKFAQVVRQLHFDAVAVHINKAHELFQPEGERRGCKVLECLKRFMEEIELPVVVREVGCGFGPEEVKALVSLKPYAIDIAGSGGTYFPLIEALRSDNNKNSNVQLQFANECAELMWPTGEVLVELYKTGAELMGTKLLCSGGIRSSVEVVKCLALGADLVGMAQPVLAACIMKGELSFERCKQFVLRLKEEVKTVMALVGARGVKDLRDAVKLELS